MPRYSLKRSPWARITSPGASSVPASSEPSMTASAPAAIAFAMSPDEVMPPSRDHRHALVALRRSAHVVDRGDLRDADAGDDARRADRAGPDPDLDRVRARVDQRLAPPRPWRCCPRRPRPSTASLIRAHHLDHAARVAVRRVDDEHVDAGVDERLRALERVGPDADRGADAQPALLVLRRLRELDLLLDVLDRDQAAQPAVAVDDRQLLDLVAVRGSPRPPRASCRPAR